MKYPYIVIHNGKWYNAGEEVPENNSSGASFDYSKTKVTLFGLIASLQMAKTD